MTTLASVLHNLKSDKIKVRQEALTKIREVFSQDKVVANFTKSDGRSNSLHWLAVFQALFEAVMAEKRAVTKPSTNKAGVSSSAATRRLSEAASVVRWLTERTVHLMNTKVIKALLRHLCQTLHHDGELLAPVALDYLKALKCLVNFTPHLEHIDDDCWVRLAELAFNVVLDDPVETKLAADANDIGTDGSESEMYVDDDSPEEMTDSAAMSPSVGKGKKRSRRDVTPTPILSPRKAKKRRNVISVSLEQVECASLLSILLSSSVSPILSPNYPGLATAILSRLQRFLERYPADSSLLHDYLTMLSSTLHHVSLNKKHAVEKFARSTWVGLVGLWGTKDRRMKEGLVVILRNLFEFVTCPSLTEESRLPPFDSVDGISRLWSLLDGEAENRRGLDGLSLDALRLQILNAATRGHAEDPFVAKTFRAGWNFDAGQALAWATLELQADCAAKLFQFSESIHPTTSGSSLPDAKRLKIPNPVFDLLNFKHEKKSTALSHVRSYRLQTLLFFVDRHWGLVHDTLKHNIVKSLLDLVVFEDVEIQSWVFLNLAAIAHEEGSITNRKSTDHEQALNATIWDSVWAHAIRKTNVPAICRAACHAGLSLLTSFYSQTHRPHLLTSNRVLLEIETFAKDMDVQGPSYPFDSVCMFLSHCLAIASQDVLLYRMHLEDKVLSWFVDSWKTPDSRIKLVPNTTADILLLLETLCGLTKRVDLIFQPLLPQSHIVDSVIEEKKVTVIRDFLLCAKLPPFIQPSDTHEGSSIPIHNSDVAKGIDPSQHFPTMTPRGRERKLSSFFHKTLESHIFDWQNNKDNHNHPTAEMARRSLDVAASAVAFESLLLLNGIGSNRQVLQTSAKLIALVIRFLAKSHWSTAEKLLVVHSLEIFIRYEEQPLGDAFREAFARPGPGSGIKKRSLQNLISNEIVAEDRSSHKRINFLRLIWQNVDSQEALGVVMTHLRTILNQTLNGSSKNGEEEVVDLDDKDGFGPIRTIHQNLPSSATSVRNPDEDRPTQHLLHICIGFLACGPFLQSPSSEPTRDKELVQLMFGTARDMPAKICHFSSIFFCQVRRGILALSPKHLCDLYDELGNLLKQYSFSKSERFLGVVLDLLTCSLGIRPDPNNMVEEVQVKFCELCGWLSSMLKKNLMRSWRLRDAFARFIELYLLDDPSQSSWPFDSNQPETEDSPHCPPLLLPQLSADADIRVRFRVAIISTRLLAFSEHINLEPLQMYDIMKRSYTLHLDNYEHMLTRMLSLGNIMVVSSAVRRGPYWHLLETCLHSQQYSNHIEAILTGVSVRLGMSSLSMLFEAYASQIAYSVSQSKGDFTGVPPHLLGYRDRKQSAEATFRLFTPTNILTGARQAFTRHCQLLQKSPVEGLRDCFGNTVGLLIVTWMLDRPNRSDAEILHLIKDTMDLGDFQSTFEENVDVIVTTILRSLGDQDFSAKGSIILALQAFDETNKIGQTFQTLNHYRSDDDNFAYHTPNLPAFPTQNTLNSLHWLSSIIPSAYTKATTYHVLQQLMREIYTTPLVNEQYRLINAMTIWMAYRQRDFGDVTLLHTLVHGASLLLSQYDLARSAQSILEWAFRCYRKNKLKDSRLPDVLIRICYIAHGFASDTRDRSTSQMGAKLLIWIEDQVDSLSTVMKPSILRALTAWPQAPSEKLMPIYNQITTETLTEVLEDHRISSNKFRLVQQIQDHTQFETSAQSRFSKFYFWRLKDCMPSSGRLQDEDVQSFTALLAQNYGKIGSFNVEQPDMNAPRFRHIHILKKRESILDSSAARNAITLGILLMLEADEPLHVSNAYQTLRLLMSVSSLNQQLHLPADYRAELELLQVYRCLPITRPVINIHEMLKTDLYLESANNFSKWITLVAVLLSDTLAVIDPYFGQLSSLLVSDIEFADQILPILVHTLLLSSKQAEPDIYKTTLSEYFTTILSWKDTDLSCTRVIVDVVLHLRHFNPQLEGALAYNRWLEVDFAVLAKAAILCGAYTTALLFVETAMERRSPQAEDSATEEVLFEIYAHIDEPDGFYGIQTKDLHQFLIKRLHHEKQWDKAFRFHGAALEAGSARSGEGVGLLQSFHHFGFDHLAIDTLRNSAGQSRESHTTSMDYKLGWRTETWDLPDQAKESSSAPLYRSLKAVYRERDPRILEDTIRSSLFEEMEHLRSLGTENLVEIRLVSRDLMCLGEILNWTQRDRQDLLKPDNTSLENWKPFVGISEQFEFSDFESLMATRISLVRSVRQREERQRIGTFVTSYVRSLIEIERSCLLRLSEAARASGQIQIALNSVIRAQRLETNPSAEVSEEFANVLWLQKEEKLAVQFLKDLVHRTPLSEGDKQSLSRKALWLSRLGTWTAEACIEKPTEIWERYFDPSILLLERVQKLDAKVDLNQATIYRECAMFSERQYHATLRSPDAIRWKVYVDRKKEEIEHRNLEIQSNSDNSRQKRLVEDQNKARKLLQADSELFKKHNTLRETFLKQAIDMHSRCLQTSDDFDNDSAIRFCSLWFANFDDESILECVKTALERIPSRKLVFLAHQITARVASPSDATLTRAQENLHHLVLRMCQEHPFHILYQVYCLSDHSSPPIGNRRQSGRLGSQSTQTDRGTAASIILDRLRSQGATSQRVQDIEMLCDACLQWAKLPIVKDPVYKQQKPPFKVPSDLQILLVSNLRVPVTTARTPLDLTLEYNHCVWIKGYETTFTTAGGVNMPKISICQGSDGQGYKQLFKGEGHDDLRQDAVMEQVFDLVNSVLKHDRESHRRELNVRDYKVVPLASQAGILEFVGNTSPLRDWLFRSHLRYNPTDIKPGDFSNRLCKVQKESSSDREKQLAVFKALRKKFHPVMRHYFTEKHKTPISWFQMRLAYTRSIATTSIVGHVLGLGDRHISNILLDNVTGEVVHIDLGIAFDQGKLLTIPERVPFRMTADIVDGMGPSGTSGVFQRCAEETLRVLREESELIMTVLEVFKHDPLHSWTASEVKIKQAQSGAPTTTTVNDTGRFNLGIGIDMRSGSADEAADRALSSVARKLDKSLSVESTVNELIAEATDPMNLATIFHGWSPHM